MLIISKFIVNIFSVKNFNFTSIFCKAACHDNPGVEKKFPESK